MKTAALFLVLAFAAQTFSSKFISSLHFVKKEFLIFLITQSQQLSN